MTPRRRASIASRSPTTARFVRPGRRVSNQAATNKGIKPIIGVETYVAPPVDDRQGGQGRQPSPTTSSCSQAILNRLPEPVAASSPTPTSMATTTSRASTASTSRSTAKASSGLSACLKRRGLNAPPRGSTTGEPRPATVASEYGDIFGKGRFSFPSRCRTHGPGRAAPPQLSSSCVLAPENWPARSSSPTTLPLRPAGASRPAHDVLLCVGTASNLDTPGPP